MIAVTGAAGFIGSNLAHRLAADGRDLLLVDESLTAAKAANLAGLDGFRYLGHERFQRALAAGDVAPTTVYHLGANSSTTETDWAKLVRQNIDYTRSLWQWCAANRVPLVYASSAATYGDGSKGFDDRTPPTDLTPLNLYGKSKNDFDAWALAEVAAGRPAPPRWAGVKFFNVYGPREGHKGRMASMVYHTRRQVLATGGVKLFRSTDPAYADGGQIRDFVFVGDCVEHCVWLATHDHPGGVYNSGTGEARSFNDLARAVFAALGRGPAIEYIDMPADLRKQYQSYTRAELGKLRAAGCDLPVTRLEDGVRRTVDWLTANG
jgi:ADP-L-glycero-D-manno-heptose 6-epimerase